MTLTFSPEMQVGGEAAEQSAAEVETGKSEQSAVAEPPHVQDLLELGCPFRQLREPGPMQPVLEEALEGSTVLQALYVFQEFTSEARAAELRLSETAESAEIDEWAEVAPMLEEDIRGELACAAAVLEAAQEALSGNTAEGRSAEVLSEVQSTPSRADMPRRALLPRDSILETFSAQARVRALREESAIMKAKKEQRTYEKAGWEDVKLRRAEEVIRERRLQKQREQLAKLQMKVVDIRRGDPVGQTLDTSLWKWKTHLREEKCLRFLVEAEVARDEATRKREALQRTQRQAVERLWSCMPGNSPMLREALLASVLASWKEITTKAVEAHAKADAALSGTKPFDEALEAAKLESAELLEVKRSLEEELAQAEDRRRSMQAKLEHAIARQEAFEEKVLGKSGRHDAAPLQAAEPPG
eukprot:TRINITY_DN124317_c0_g1_i1.p1 TRINITY_DN124317_c0_g1~~TRINITY_DN124317_c0_g1_i1.p1  ORF type:complete len:415 (+),score=143.99 TRINITY_DN124317_c0_g1_i1:146-1390(+)